MTTIVSTGADSFSLQPAKNQWVFRMADASLVIVKVEPTTPGAGYTITRTRSTDGGLTWTALPSFTLVGNAGLNTNGVVAMIQNGDTIYGFNANFVTPGSSVMFKMAYAAGAFTDTSATYTPTVNWFGALDPDSCIEIRYDSVKAALHVALDTYNGGGATSQINLLSFTTALAKITEVSWTSAVLIGTTLRVNTAASPKVFVAYITAATTIKYRSYTFNGTTYTAADAEETATAALAGVLLGTTSGGLLSSLDASGNYDVFVNDAGTLYTLKRTGVATWSALTSLASNLPVTSTPGIVGGHMALCETGNANRDVWVFFKSILSFPNGELTWVYRVNGAWSAAPAATPILSGGSSAGRAKPAPIPTIQSDNRIHIVYLVGNQSSPNPLALYYDYLDIGVPGTPTNIKPADGSQGVVPTISATYVQNLSWDNLAKYRVIVQRQSDSAVFWDTTLTVWAGATVKPGGTFSIAYAGTALVAGTGYKVQVQLADALGYTSSSAFVNFTPNLPPVGVAVSITTDQANAKAKLALRPLAPDGTMTVAPVTADIYRKLTSASTYAALTTGLGFTAPTTQTGFSAYRQCPNLGLARNLVTNGGTVNAHGWTLHANASIVADATSLSGYALRTLATGAGNNSYQSLPVEAGKAYSVAAQFRGDGVGTSFMYFDWNDAGGNLISRVFLFNGIGTTAWTEYSLANQVAPGNARTMRITVDNAAPGGIFFSTAWRVLQQTAAPAAWLAAHQQFVQRGVSIYEASTNRLADGDMEAVGTASWGATAATLTKDTTKFFAGAKSLKVVTTAGAGYASQTGALAAGSAITASVRHLQGSGTNGGIVLISTPSNVTIGAASVGTDADWTARRASGVIAPGDTGWLLEFQGGAGVGDTSYFDNAAVEYLAYDTMNADPNGLAFNVGARTASVATAPAPTTFDLASFAFVVAFRMDMPSGAVRMPFAIWTQNTNYFDVYYNAGQFFAQKNRGGTIATLNGPVLTANAGDTCVVGFKFSTALGLAMYVSVNGSAPTLHTIATPEALLPINGAAPVLHIGALNEGAGFYWIDGTIGIVRILKGGLTDATVQAIVANPYQDPTDNDLAVWIGEGFLAQLPVFDDRLVQLGLGNDYQGQSVSSPGVRTVSASPFSATVPVAADAWWLRDAQNAALDVKLPVIEQFPYEVERDTYVPKPLAGGKQQVIKAAAPFGEHGKLRLKYVTVADQSAKDAAIRAALATDDDLWIQDPFGGLRKCALVGPVGFSKYMTILDADLAYVEIP